MQQFMERETEKCSNVEFSKEKTTFGSFDCYSESIYENLRTENTKISKKSEKMMLD